LAAFSTHGIDVIWQKELDGWHSVVGKS